MKTRSAAAVLGAVLLLSGCGAAPAEAPLPEAALPAQQAAYRFGVGYSSSGYDESMERWRSLVLERTDGNLELELFGDNRLGEGADMAKAVQRGTLSVVASSTSVCTELVPQAAVMDLPACYDQYIQPFRVYTGPFYEALNECYRDQGLELLFLRTGEGWILSSSQPVTSLSQLQGMRIRTSGSRYHNMLYDSLGIQRLENVSLNALAYVLEEGQADGLESTCSILSTHKLTEMQPYGFGYLFVMSSAVAMNREAYDALPADYQEILKASLREVLSDEQGRLREGNAANAITVNHLSPADREQLQQLAQPMMDEIRSVAGESLLDALAKENAGF